MRSAEPVPTAAPLATALLAATALLGGACASPLGGEDLELSAGVSASPGVGGTLGFAQRAWSDARRRVDVELDWTRQEIDRAPGPNADDRLDLVRLGLRLRWLPSDWLGRWHLRGGVAWMRVKGDAEYLDEPGDYGGIYLGTGLELPLGEHLVTGPDVTVHLVDSEGSGDSGVVPQLGWRLTWRL